MRVVISWDQQIILNNTLANTLIILQGTYFTTTQTRKSRYMQAFHFFSEPFTSQITDNKSSSILIKRRMFEKEEQIPAIFIIV